MVVSVTNAQRGFPVSVERIARLIRCAVARLGIRAAGEISVSFLTAGRMRAVNRRFTGHDRTTDVLSFRYDGRASRGGRARRRGHLKPPRPPDRRSVVGDILVAPSQARAYASAHGLPYDQELCRYVIHGLLHWMGHEDRAPAQRRQMRAREDQVLSECWRSDHRGGKGRKRRAGAAQAPRAPT